MVNAISHIGRGPHDYSPSQPVEEKTFTALVVQYMDGSAEAHQRLVREYGIDLGKRTYKATPIPVSPQKTVTDVARIGFTLFQIDQRKVEQSVEKTGSFGIPALILSRNIHLLARLNEVIRSLVRHPGMQAMQKAYLAKAQELVNIAGALFEDIKGKLDHPHHVEDFFRDMGSRMAFLEKALKKQAWGEADFYMADMDDRIQKLKSQSAGMFKRLLELAGASTSSYEDDRKKAQGQMESIEQLFARYDQEIVQRQPWTALREEANALKKELARLPSPEKSITMGESMAAVDLYLKSTELLGKYMDFIEESVPNAFEDFHI